MRLSRHAKTLAAAAAAVIVVILAALSLFAGQFGAPSRVVLIVDGVPEPSEAYFEMSEFTIGLLPESARKVFLEAFKGGNASGSISPEDARIVRAVLQALDFQKNNTITNRFLRDGEFYSWGTREVGLR